VNNADWTVTDMGGYFQCTLNTGKSINGKGHSFLGFTVVRTGAATSGTTQNITAAILPNSGGDTNSANNSTTTVITAL
jgi:hypothetical protein